MVDGPTTRSLARGAVSGLLLGLITQVAQGFLPDMLQPVANSISPWLTVAFVVGATAPRPSVAALSGWLSLIAALVGYYGLVWLRFGYGPAGSALILWTAAAIAGGFVFGASGWFWRQQGRTGSIVAIGLLAAVFISEAAYLFRILRDEVRLFAIAYLVVGLLIPLVLGRSRRERLLGYAAVIPALALAVVGYVALLTLANVVAGG